MMDPNLQNIILGVIANSLTSITGYLGRKGKDFLVGKELQKKLKTKKTSLQPILKNAVDAVAEAIDLTGTEKMEEISLFLMSPESESIIRQIYSVHLSKDNKSNNLDSIQQEFLTALSLYTGIKKDKIADAAKKFFAAMIEGTEKALSIAIDEGILSAHEAKSMFRHRLILDELASIQKNLDFLTSQVQIPVKAILEFEKKYRQQVASRHRYITPPHFDEAKNQPIDSLYVKPNFEYNAKTREEESHTISHSEFLSASYRTVILGNPGAGKSTFSLKLCHDLGSNYSDRLFSGRQLTPVLVVLRDYGAEKKEKKCSILEFIESRANSLYQIKPPPGAFEYLFLNGRVVVIFDGLDELLDTSYRREISGDIEAFCNLYPAVPILVTSRKVGYEQAPLDHKRFETFHLAEFDEEQVKEYVMKWFKLDTDMTEKQQKQKTESFMNESGLVSDLRSNPLMLALMCNIYRGENYIPKNRPDVYEKCATMLFERWDKSRSINVQLPIEHHVKPIIMYLAHWIYSDEKLQGGVTEEKIIVKTTVYLCEKRFEDREEARSAAEELIRFFRGRAWVFTDTGTTSAGERLFQFTHRTFLEYFTAAYLVRTHPTAKELQRILFPRIEKREWDNVAQQAFQILNKNVEGAGDELISSLIDKAEKSKTKAKKWNILSFAARALEFIVPSPRVLRTVTTVCIENFFALDLIAPVKNIVDIKLNLREIPDHNPASVIGALLIAAAENRKTIANTLENILVEKINKGNDGESILAVEMGLNFEILLHGIGRTPSVDLPEFWSSISTNIEKGCIDRIKYLSPKHFGTCLTAFFRDIIMIETLVHWYSIGHIYQEYPYSTDPYVTSLPIANSLAGFIMMDIFTFKENFLKHRTKNLINLGKIFINLKTPFIKREKLRYYLKHLTYRWEEKAQFKDYQKIVDFNNDTMFAGFVLIAIELESVDDSRRNSMIKIIKNKDNPLFELIGNIFIARYDKIKPEDVQFEMDACGFSKKQQAFIRQWIRKEISLVDLKSSKESRNEVD